jgi:predicted membrane protein
MKLRNTQHKNSVTKIQLILGEVLITIGLIVFLKREYQVDLKPFIFPIALTGLGLWMIFGNRRNKTNGDENEVKAEETRSIRPEFLNTTAIFAESQQFAQRPNIEGAGIVSVFGNASIDFTPIALHHRDHLEIEIFQLFGNTSITIPADWSVDSQVTCILGEIRERKGEGRSFSVDKTPMVTLKGQSILGSITIIRSFI